MLPLPRFRSFYRRQFANPRARRRCHADRRQTRTPRHGASSSLQGFILLASRDASMFLMARPDEGHRRMNDKTKRKVCPECGYVFKGNGWDGIDAHWRAKHEHVKPYAEAWPLLRANKYPARSK